MHDCQAFDKQAVCGAHNAPVRHVDFTEDSKHVQSDCDGHELLFFDAVAGKQITAPSVLKDSGWATQRCVYGWQVQGLWKDAQAESTSTGGTKLVLVPPAVHAVDRSRDGRLLVSGDSLGRVLLHRFPCVEDGHGVAVGLGHAGAVTNVRFSPDARRVLSTGGADRAVFQWRLRKKKKQQ